MSTTTTTIIITFSTTTIYYIYYYLLHLLLLILQHLSATLEERGLLQELNSALLVNQTHWSQKKTEAVQYLETCENEYRYVLNCLFDCLYFIFACILACMLLLGIGNNFFTYLLLLSHYILHTLM